MRYFAIIHPGETLEDCFRVGRHGEGRFEEFDFEKDGWIINDELFLIFAGEPEVEDITEAQASEIIDRIRKRRESFASGKRRA